MIGTYTYLYNKSQQIFMHMLLLQLDCSGSCINVCCLTYVVVYELFCMQLYEYCCICAVGLTINLDLWVDLLSSLWCIFAHVFPSKPSIITCFQRLDSPHSPCVRTSRAPSLTRCSYHTLATNRDILLAFVWNHGHGITVWPTARNPTPNSLRSNCDFLLGRSLDMFAGPTP